jgi:hypothetical protein
MLELLRYPQQLPWCIRRRKQLPNAQQTRVVRIQLSKPRAERHDFALGTVSALQGAQRSNAKYKVQPTALVH